jgi:hypothetical protein
MGKKLDELASDTFDQLLASQTPSPGKYPGIARPWKMP